MSYVRDSVEFFKFSLTDRDGEDLTANTVECAIEVPGTTASPTWLPCTHESGNIWRTTGTVTWTTANYPGTRFHAWARVTDSPETPWADLGPVTIKER